MNNNDIENFRSFMAENGIPTSDPIIANEQLQRFHIEGDKAGSKNGWLILYDGALPLGMFGDWKTDIKGRWTSKPKKEMTWGERESVRHRLKKAAAQQKTAETDKHTRSAHKAEKLWSKAKPLFNEHGYLRTKKVPSNGLRVDDQDNLLIPIRNSKNELTSLQFIASNGDKRFLAGGAIKGNYYSFGDTHSNNLFICEGYATGAAIYEALGGLIFVAFNTTKLSSVAQVVKESFPDSIIVICGDNDQWTENNPGKTKASEAAKNVNCRWVVPIFKDSSTRPTDFNDLYCLEGAAEVKKQIEAATNNSNNHKGKLTVYSVKDLLLKDIPPRTNLLEPWLPTQGLCMIHAQRGVGKTHIALGVACAVATGGTFLKWSAPKSQGVLLLDGEMPARAMQERLASLLTGIGAEPPSNLMIITPDFQEFGMPNISTPEGQEEINHLIDDSIKLIIIDNISTVGT